MAQWTKRIELRVRRVDGRGGVSVNFSRISEWMCKYLGLNKCMNLLSMDISVNRSIDLSVNEWMKD